MRLADRGRKGGELAGEGAQLWMRMARPKGFEPLTPRFVVWCSIQLSYGRAHRWQGSEGPRHRGALRSAQPGDPMAIE